MERVYAVQDQDGHWYVIPYELREQFFEDEEVGGNDDFESFNKKYAHYRTGGDLNLVELYAKI